MADEKPTSNYYQNLGGINLKSSAYNMSTAQFLNLRNIDFDVPNALQLRPGSTQALTPRTSGPLSSVFEFIKLAGASYVVTGSDAAMFYMAGGGLTLLSAGWNNGQPTDMLTFADKLWMANGGKWQWWDASSVNPAGLPMASARAVNNSGGASIGVFSVLGITTAAYVSATVGARAILYLAYGYIRGDGYHSPLSYLAPAIFSPRSVGIGPAWQDGIAFGDYGNNVTLVASGFTVPSGYNISQISIFLYVDQFTGLTSTFSKNVIKLGDLSIGPIPSTADLSVFRFFTAIPSNTATFIISGITRPWGDINVAYPGFSNMTFDWFTTNTPKYIEVSQNTMFMGGFSASPSTAWFSEVGSPESLLPDSFFEVRTNDGDKMYAMKAYNNQILFMKEHSFHKLIGDSARNYQLIEISNEYGCISQQSVVEFNQKLAWIDRKGVLEFNGANHFIISTPVEPIFRRMNLSAAREKACSVHHVYRNQLWFGIPIDGSSVNNITVVYDYLVNGWTFFDGFNPASFTLAKAQLSKPTVWRGDYSGMLHYFSESFYGDNGAGITALGLTRFENEGGENQTSIWRRFFLDVAAASGLTGQITGQVFSNYNATTIQATFAMYQDVFQSRAEFGVAGKAVAIQFARTSASLPLLINGYGLAKRGLRNV